ncbi:MAG: nucleoside hydrolase [Chloroflexi bacterium]|nr:nucleoside hydrolase [Chloroflexota bacterium]MCY3937322.1 nucleoside hydrolase [Chloroflexota bacterium]
MIDAIIDTDPGIDDALAILLALKSGRFRVHAMTTVAGNSPIEDTTANAEFLLALAGRGDIPLYTGARKPLQRDLVTAPVHGKGGLAGVRQDRPASLTDDAPAKTVEIVRDSTQPITLIALGPLTNVAQAILLDAEAMSRVQEIVVMGGTFGGPGNMPHGSEFNLYVDPEAADIVFRFPVRTAVVPLEVCDPLKFHSDYFKALRDEDIRRPVTRMMSGFYETLLSLKQEAGVALYDPITVYYAINPSAFKLTPRQISIGLDDSTDRGRTTGTAVIDSESSGLNFVAESLDLQAFRRDFIKLLNG